MFGPLDVQASIGYIENMSAKHVRRDFARVSASPVFRRWSSRSVVWAVHLLDRGVEQRIEAGENPGLRPQQRARVLAAALGMPDEWDSTLMRELESLARAKAHGVAWGMITKCAMHTRGCSGSRCEKGLPYPIRGIPESSRAG